MKQGLWLAMKQSFRELTEDLWKTMNIMSTRTIRLQNTVSKLQFTGYYRTNNKERKREKWVRMFREVLHQSIFWTKVSIDLDYTPLCVLLPANHTIKTLFLLFLQKLWTRQERKGLPWWLQMSSYLRKFLYIYKHGWKQCVFKDNEIGEIGVWNNGFFVYPATWLLLIIQGLQSLTME